MSFLFLLTNHGIKSFYVRFGHWFYVISIAALEFTYEEIPLLRQSRVKKEGSGLSNVGWITWRYQYRNALVVLAPIFDRMYSPVLYIAMASSRPDRLSRLCPTGRRSQSRITIQHVCSLRIIEFPVLARAKLIELKKPARVIDC